jgi:hypothetical protein
VWTLEQMDCNSLRAGINVEQCCSTGYVRNPVWLRSHIWTTMALTCPSQELKGGKKNCNSPATVLQTLLPSAGVTLSEEEGGGSQCPGDCSNAIYIAECMVRL